ncbi:MAG: T9SS type A sorting domain-containing protein [Bacteroidales bacterium]
MKNFCFTVLVAFFLPLATSAQAYLVPREGIRASAWFPDHPVTGAFDVNDTLLMVHNSGSIQLLDVRDGALKATLTEPGDYLPVHFVSFVALSPDGKSLWTGYTTSDFSDDRLYRIDLATGAWTHMATFPGNYDLEFWNDHLLVSGLNSRDWFAPNGIYLLDATGADDHRLLVETGGYSAGMAVDSQGNLHYGTSFGMDPNGLYRWDSARISGIISDSEADPLGLTDGLLLSGLPAGAADCALDDADSLFVNMNVYGGTKVLARWTGRFGEGVHLDTLAEATGEGDWLGSIGTRGAFHRAQAGNAVFTFSYGMALTEVHADYAPEVILPLTDLEVTDPDDDSLVSLAGVFSDPDDPDDEIVLTLAGNSDPTLVGAEVDSEVLRISFPDDRSGSAELVIRAESKGRYVTDTLTVRVTSTTGMDRNPWVEMTVYPNPASHEIWVDSGPFVPAVLRLFSLEGVCVGAFRVESGPARIGLPSLPPGTYILQMDSASGSVRQRIQIL